jgi:dTDP-4-amino-4,6-dideoxygalactose transaminase
MAMRHQLPAYSPVSAKAALLAAGQLLDLGNDPRPMLQALLQREYDDRRVLLCGSGTQALTIAIQEARRRVDPEAPIALPAFSCFDVASAAVGADARVSLYDLDPATLGPELESVERVLRAGAGVVVVAPLYGIPVDWQALASLAARNDAVLVEDAAQGDGAVWKGKRLGTLGDIATLSFGRGKGWTGGSGGAVLMRDSADSSRRDFSEPAFSRQAAVTIGVIAQWAVARPAVYRIPLSIPMLRLGQTTYLAPRPISSMTRSAAATLVATHRASQMEAQARQANAAQLLAAITDNPAARAIAVHSEGTAGYLRLPLRLVKGMAGLRDQQPALALGVAPSYPKSLAELPQLAARLTGPERVWVGTQTLVKELLTLPTHSQLTPREIASLRAIVRDFGR